MRALLFLDIETTGLDPEKDQLIEMSINIVDFNFNVIAKTYTPVFHVDTSLMDDFVTKMHTDTGLMDRIHTSIYYEPYYYDRWDDLLYKWLEYVKEDIGLEVFYLAGNTVHFDRSFLKKFFPKFEKQLHYRHFDLSIFKVMAEMGQISEIPYEKVQPEHRASTDVQTSINQAKEVMKWLTR